MATPTESTAPDSRKLPEWQRRAIGSLTWKLALAAIVVTLGMGFFGQFFPDSSHTSSHLLWIPWMVAFLMGIPIAYRQGIRDARTHREG